MVLCLLMLFAALAQSRPLVLQGGDVWSEGQLHRGWAVRMQDGLIQSVGPAGPLPEGVDWIDTAGAVVMPGLIDAHVHLSLDPGAHWRPTDPPTHARLLAAHRRALLASGVTTVLDPAILPAELGLVRAQEAAGLPGPRVLTTGVPLSPKDGYVSVVVPGFPGFSTRAEIAAQLDENVALGAVGVKVTLEPGMLRPIWPLFTPEQLSWIRAEAAARALPIYVHAMSPAMQRLAIEALGAHATVHPLDRPDAGVIAAARRAGTYEISTLAAFDVQRYPWSPERLADPLLDRLVPPEELATARAPDMGRRFLQANLDHLWPGMPFSRLALHSPGPRVLWAAQWQRRRAAIRALHQSGVRLVMGSDSGNWPVIPYLFHGWSSLRELALLVEAGLRPDEALQAATERTADMLNRPDLGRVRPGGKADLIVVPGAPLTEIGALRQIAWVIAAGEARRPEAWLAATPDQR